MSKLHLEAYNKELEPISVKFSQPAVGGTVKTILNLDYLDCLNPYNLISNTIANFSSSSMFGVEISGQTIPFIFKGENQYYYIEPSVDNQSPKEIIIPTGSTYPLLVMDRFKVYIGIENNSYNFSSTKYTLSIIDTLSEIVEKEIIDHSKSRAFLCF